MTATTHRTARDLAQARQDDRYPTVLHEIQQANWALGGAHIPDGHAEILAARIVAALRQQEGQEGTAP